MKLSEGHNRQRCYIFFVCEIENKKKLNFRKMSTCKMLEKFPTCPFSLAGLVFPNISQFDLST